MRSALSPAKKTAPTPVSAKTAMSPTVVPLAYATPSKSCACGGGCPRCRGAEPKAATRAPSAVHDVLRTSGAPLPAPVRADMQERLGEDLGGVRVHTDPQAARSAEMMNARAYTVGSHIVFDAGQYAPHSARGRHTLAHELTHVLQQRGAAPSASLAIGPSGDAAEREAEHVAASVATGPTGPAQVRARSSMQMLRRQEYGVAGAIRSGRMREVPGVHRTLFSAYDCFGRPGCEVDFMFASAYVGEFQEVAGGTIRRGAHVNIHAIQTPECGSCDTLEIVQVLRDIRHGPGGATELAEPSDTPLPPGVVRTPELDRMYRARHLRSGWDDPSAPSRGWRIDAATPRDTEPGYDPTDPFYTHVRRSGIQSGTPGHEAVIHDTPSNYDTEFNVGRDFQTCLICVSGGSRSVLGCLTWGMYIDAT
ncbi:MAG TPA: DUF4157 domain-containing protein, partial [Burkholderiales bacterium]|nr:DUF4157 domain-containing protein [Burkholderiales bacterium]